MEGNKLNSIDHTFPYLLLGSKDKQLNTLDPRSRLSDADFFDMVNDGEVKINP